MTSRLPESKVRDLATKVKISPSVIANAMAGEFLPKVDRRGHGRVQDCHTNAMREFRNNRASVWSGYMVFPVPHENRWNIYTHSWNEKDGEFYDTTPLDVPEIYYFGFPVPQGDLKGYAYLNKLSPSYIRRALSSVEVAAAEDVLEQYVASRNFVHRRDPNVCDVKVLSTKRHPTWVEESAVWSMDGCPDTNMESAYALDGSYIGTADDGRFFEKEGIVPERSRPDHKTASIGFQPSSGKWWGWSHRARTNFDTRPEAVKFAESVSHVQETSMYKSIKHLLAAADDPDVEPDSASHKMAALSVPVRRALRVLTGISAAVEEYGEMAVSPLRIRDEAPLYDLYCLLNVGIDGAMFIPQVQHASLIRRAEGGIRAATRSMPGTDLVGVYVRPRSQTQIELGARFVRSGNDG